MNGKTSGGSNQDGGGGKSLPSGGGSGNQNKGGSGGTGGSAQDWSKGAPPSGGDDQGGKTSSGGSGGQGKGGSGEGGSGGQGKSSPKASGNGGKATLECPPCPLRRLSVQWSVDEVYCADPAALNGTASGITEEVEAQATILSKGNAVGSGSAKGQSNFKVDWKASGINFEKPAGTMPEKLPVVGQLSADGLQATTPKALAAKRLPDKAPEKVSFTCKSPKSVNGTNNYEWTAAFKLGVEDASIKLKQTLQIKKAWLGKWVSLDAKKDKTAQGWGFVKKDGVAWKYWNNTDSAWKALPRDIGQYTVTNIVFVEKGGKFVGRDDATQTWPESFSQPKDYESMKTKWLKNIHDTWDKKFKVKHKECTGVGLCEWDLRVQVNWSAGAGDKLVWAIWAADWERSNASDWFLSETRLGVAGHECGHLLGAYDEYTGGAIHPKTKKIVDNSIMGQNLTTAYPRHLDDMRKQLKKKISSWIGRDWPLVVKAR